MPKIAEIVKVPADPAANNEILWTADEDCIVHSVAFHLTTDANVANRFIVLQADDGTNRFWYVAFQQAQAASVSRDYSAYEGCPFSQGANPNTAPLPTTGLRLRKGDRLGTSTSSRQVGDDYSVVFLQIERQ